MGNGTESYEYCKFVFLTSDLGAEFTKQFLKSPLNVPIESQSLEKSLQDAYNVSYNGLHPFCFV